MKNLLIALSIFYTSSVFANEQTKLHSVAKELERAVTLNYDYKFTVAYGGRIVLISDACLDIDFITELKKKYAFPAETQRIKDLGVKKMLCSYGRTETRIF